MSSWERGRLPWAHLKIVLHLFPVCLKIHLPESLTASLGVNQYHLHAHWTQETRTHRILVQGTSGCMHNAASQDDLSGEFSDLIISMLATKSQENDTARHCLVHTPIIWQGQHKIIKIHKNGRMQFCTLFVDNVSQDIYVLVAVA